MIIENAAELKAFDVLCSGVETTEGFLELYYTSKHIYAGSSTNVGFGATHKHEIDDCFSLDANLQAFIEDLEEQGEITLLGSEVA